MSLIYLATHQAVEGESGHSVAEQRNAQTEAVSEEENQVLSIPTVQGRPPSHLNRKGAVLAAPRKPTRGISKFKTKRYRRYDGQRVLPATEETYKGTHKIYDGYSLLMDPSITRVAELPLKKNVRLDDRLVAIALAEYGDTNKGVKFLHENFASEIDHEGMPRARRMPLGNAAKVFKDIGDIDLDGNVVQQGGYFYLWWRGIHPLIGEEGFGAGLYLVRPCWEVERCSGFAFKTGYRAVVQSPT